MHVGLDGLPLTAQKTGVGHYTWELACALASYQPASRFEVVYPSTYPPIGLEESNGALPANLKLNRSRVGPLGRHWWSVGLPRYVTRRKIQLFHGTNYDVPLWRRCATVLTIHDLSLLLHSATHEKRSVNRAHRRLPHMIRVADAVITPTESVRNDVCEILKVDPKMVFAIPEAARARFRPMPFPETAAVRKRLGIGDNFLLAVGTLEPRKNLALLIEAFAGFAKARPEQNKQLVIAGSRGWLSSPLFAAIEQSPVRDRIVLTDYLHDDDLQALYSSCQAFVYPSIYEGFGLPPMEAMACGAPVIASRIPAHEETTAGAALLFDPKSSAELTRHILELSDNDNLRREIAAAGQQRAAEFSWGKTAQLTWNVYEKAFQQFARSKSGGKPAFPT